MGMLLCDKPSPAFAAPMPAKNILILLFISNK
jgi:hypothetical protein